MTGNEDLETDLILIPSGSPQTEADAFVLQFVERVRAMAGPHGGLRMVECCLSAVIMLVARTQQDPAAFADWLRGFADDFPQHVAKVRLANTRPANSEDKPL
ncbi:hypothetical protein [Pelagibius sp.]|uniref:hypothetical protein n=1 Tax=Pelagibius sp. TaxID=1931238 RepID=UPI002630D11F|nr:hypothetical protein [Pelagibius sp.]